jgi:hypothetical protein
VSLRRAFATSCILIQSKALTNGSSIPPLPGDGVGDQIISPHACETSASNVVSASSASMKEITEHVSYRSHHHFCVQTYLETPNSLARCLGMGSLPLHRHSGMTSEPSSKLECLRPCREYTLLQVYKSYADLRRHLSWLNTVDTNPIGAAAINTLTETTTTWGAGSAGTVLGKRARNRCGLSHETPNSLTTITVGQARVGPWMRQRVPGRGFTLRQPPGPNK